MAASLAAARLAGELGVRVTLDIESVRPRCEELLSLTDVVIGSRGFAEAFSGAAGAREGARATYERVRGPGRGKVVVVTDGPRGSYVVAAEGEFHQPAFEVAVVDTTGCGDVYHGAFAWALARQMGLEEAARMASATAALKCRALGGRAGIPTRAEVEAFLAGGPKVLS
jgi:ribokinase